MHDEPSGGHTMFLVKMSPNVMKIHSALTDQAMTAKQPEQRTEPPDTVAAPGGHVESNLLHCIWCEMIAQKIDQILSTVWKGQQQG